jgi:hypothetical protein
MGFDLCDCSLKIWESIETPTPKMGIHLGVWGFIPSHSPTLLRAWIVTPRFPFWPTYLQALALVASPRLGLWHIMFIEVAIIFLKLQTLVASHVIMFYQKNTYHKDNCTPWKLSQLKKQRKNTKRWTKKKSNLSQWQNNQTTTSYKLVT